MENVVELLHVEKSIWCKLNLATGEKCYYTGSEKEAGFTGLYYEAMIFFAIYPTKGGPIMSYGGNEYPLTEIRFHEYNNLDGPDVP